MAESNDPIESLRANHSRAGFGYQLQSRRVARGWTEKMLADEINRVEPKDIMANDVKSWELGRSIPEEDVLDTIIELLVNQNQKLEPKSKQDWAIRLRMAAKNFRLQTDASAMSLDPPTEVDFSVLMRALHKVNDGLSDAELATKINCSLAKPLESLDAQDVIDLEHGIKYPTVSIMTRLKQALEISHTEYEMLKQSIHSASGKATYEESATLLWEAHMKQHFPEGVVLGNNKEPVKNLATENFYSTGSGRILVKSPEAAKSINGAMICYEKAMRDMGIDPSQDRAWSEIKSTIGGISQVKLTRD